MSEAPQNDLGSALLGTQGETVRINMDGFESAKPETTPADQPIDLEKLGVNKEDIFSLLTPKPPEKYIFRKSIGRGGMKMVIQVKDRDTMRDIAMAVFPDAANRPAAETKRFIEEARITASLEHPNIVPVYDIGVDASGSPYFTMKLLRGETLASILKKMDAEDPEYKELYPLDTLLRIFIKVCNAVAFAHSKGVIHLDLKPENIQVGDFGEVLLMDFGLAKVISKSADHADDPAPVFTQQKIAPGLTLDGITKGTPGYMAPEQAAGRNSQKDFKTDIYALGAILYAIATCKNPLADRSDMKQMMMDTVNGKIIPPRERTPERLIPSALEAVILKAMSLSPENRYQSATALREEVGAFLGGFATLAEKAGILKRISLFIRRNKITFPAITVSIFLLLGFSFYAMEESARLKSGWIEVYADDYTDGVIDTDQVTFYNSTLFSESESWKISNTGLTLRHGEWIFFQNFKLTNGVRTVLKVIPAKGNSLIISISANAAPAKYSWEFPAGYTFVLSEYGGALDIIYKSQTTGNGSILASSESALIPEKLNTVVIERENERFSIQINGKTTLETIDLFPLSTANHGAVAIRSEGRGSVLKALELQRLALPEKASPLIAGDILRERKHYTEAVEQYLTIADNYSSGPITDAALAKAYSTAATFFQDKNERNRVMQNIRQKLNPIMQTYKYKELILEMDAVTHWINEDYQKSLQAANQLLQMNPNTEIMLKILQLPHRELAPDVAEDLLDNIAKNNRLTRIDLSGFGISSLKKLKGMRLNYLNCSGNKLTDLDGLQKMPLESLNCSDNQITSLEPLRFIPIKTLACNQNRITSLEPLNMSKMKSLNASFNQLEDLDFSNADNLELLSIRGNRIKSLIPLYGIGLKTLDAGQNQFNTLTPLCGMPLETLLVDGSGISNLNPVKDMRLINLGLHQCQQLQDISPIFQMDSLQMLSLPPNPEEIEPLRQLPALMFITDSAITPKSQKSETADAFWERFDNK